MVLDLPLAVVGALEVDEVAVIVGVVVVPVVYLVQEPAVVLYPNP